MMHEICEEMSGKALNVLHLDSPVSVQRTVAVEQGAPHYTLYVEKPTQQATMTHHLAFDSPIRLVIFLGI